MPCMVGDVDARVAKEVKIARLSSPRASMRTSRASCRSSMVPAVQAPPLACSMASTSTGSIRRLAACHAAVARTSRTSPRCLPNFVASSTRFVRTCCSPSRWVRASTRSVAPIRRRMHPAQDGLCEVTGAGRCLHLGIKWRRCEWHATEDGGKRLELSLAIHAGSAGPGPALFYPVATEVARYWGKRARMAPRMPGRSSPAMVSTSSRLPCSR